MNDVLRQALVESLEYLRALQRENIRPEEARDRLQALRRRHPELEIDLLAEEETYDQTVHYDALLRVAGEGTVSVSYCPERAIPWPLRGVHRWDEGDLVRVNSNVLQVDAAMACLDFIWDEAPVIERLVNMCLIHEELEREPIELSDAELQEAMDKFRSAKKLYKAEDTLRWLERHGMSHEKLESYVSETALVTKLRDRVAGGRVEAYFQQHARDFDTAWIARLEVASETAACQLAEQIRSGLDFYAAAERVFCDRLQPRPAEMFAILERRETVPGLREQLFAAAAGQVIGPVPCETGYELIRVLAIQPGCLDDRTRAAVKKALFEEWLAERRQAARIEWCWGNVVATST